eukprot:TRINITY_DN24304_c0_g1_i1.p1 TRINITY_DN24304_c0_g1~~TRINITY_DN24304_c0_g1_i1.p1  ORF type:complete len:426 (+),score=38.66 TRINITY_DN24304_c0_g1_i1:105-1382(+)
MALMRPPALCRHGVRTNWQRRASQRIYQRRVFAVCCLSCLTLHVFRPSSAEGFVPLQAQEPCTGSSGHGAQQDAYRLNGAEADGRDARTAMNAVGRKSSAVAESVGDISPMADRSFADDLAAALQTPTGLLVQISSVLLAATLNIWGTLDLDPGSRSILEKVETLVQAIIIAEFSVRWCSENWKLSSLLQLDMIVDFLAFLPLLLRVLLGSAGDVLPDLMFLRVLRLPRFELSLIDSYKGVVSPFLLESIVALGSLFTLDVFFAGLFYIAEQGENQNIKNFFDAMYFMLITVSTVGYGFITPATIGGRVVVCFAIVVGVGIFPLLLERLLSAAQQKNSETFAAATEATAQESMELLVQRLDRQEQQIDAMAHTLQARCHAVCSGCGQAWHRKAARFCDCCGKALPGAADSTTGTPKDDKPSSSIV